MREEREQQSPVKKPRLPVAQSLFSFTIYVVGRVALQRSIMFQDQHFQRFLDFMRAHFCELMERQNTQLGLFTQEHRFKFRGPPDSVSVIGMQAHPGPNGTKHIGDSSEPVGSDSIQQADVRRS